MSDLQNPMINEIFPTFDVIRLPLHNNLPDYQGKDPYHFWAREVILDAMADRAKARGNYLRRYRIEFIHDTDGNKYMQGQCMEYPITDECSDGGETLSKD